MDGASKVCSWHPIVGTWTPCEKQFNEVYFLADVESLYVNYAWKKQGEKICKVEASAKRYAKSVRLTQMDRGLQKVHD